MTEAQLARLVGTPYRRLWLVLALLIPATLLAFAGSYFAGVTFSGLSLTPLLHAHAALMVAWIVMLPVQAWLFHTGRLALHRTVGRSSYVLVPVLLVLAALLSHQTLVRKPEITEVDSRLVIYDVMQILGFGAAWALALVYRRSTPLHVRFMVSTVFAMGSTILFRILLNWFSWIPGFDLAAAPENIYVVAAVNGSLLVLTLLFLIAVDWRRGIRCSPYWLVTVTNAVLHLGFFTFTKSEAWSAGVRWFAGLPL